MHSRLKAAPDTNPLWLVYCALSTFSTSYSESSQYLINTVALLREMCCTSSLSHNKSLCLYFVWKQVFPNAGPQGSLYFTLFFLSPTSQHASTKKSGALNNLYCSVESSGKAKNVDCLRLSSFSHHCKGSFIVDQVISTLK